MENEEKKKEEELKKETEKEAEQTPPTKQYNPRSCILKKLQDEG